MMKFSFIIASLGKRWLLQNCIDSIERAYQHRKGSDIEILVVFQDVKEKHCKFKTKYPGLISFYYIEEKGLSKARNYAMKKSRGDIFIFLDDDAEIKEDFLDILSGSSLTADTEAFCGRILEKDTNRCFSLCFRDDKKRYLSRANFKYFMGSAHIFRKSIIDKIGFYDERFGVGAKYPGAEESDMFFRLKRLGLKVAYLPELIFYHPIEEQTPAPKAFSHSHSIGAMLTKQIFTDIEHSPTYLLIIAEFISKTFLRTLQTIFFLESIRIKDQKFPYSSLFAGILKGIFDYTKDEGARKIGRRL